MHLKLSVKRFYHNTLFRLLRTFFGEITFAKLNILFRREGERGVAGRGEAEDCGRAGSAADASPRER